MTTPAGGSGPNPLKKTNLRSSGERALVTIGGKKYRIELVYANKATTIVKKTDTVAHQLFQALASDLSEKKALKPLSDGTIVLGKQLLDSHGEKRLSDTTTKNLIDLTTPTRADDLATNLKDSPSKAEAEAALSALGKKDVEKPEDELTKLVNEVKGEKADLPKETIAYRLLAKHKPNEYFGLTAFTVNYLWKRALDNVTQGAEPPKEIGVHLVPDDGSTSASESEDGNDFGDVDLFGDGDSETDSTPSSSSSTVASKDHTPPSTPTSPHAGRTDDANHIQPAGTVGPPSEVDDGSTEEESETPTEPSRRGSTPFLSLGLGSPPTRPNPESEEGTGVGDAASTRSSHTDGSGGSAAPTDSVHESDRASQDTDAASTRSSHTDGSIGSAAPTKSVDGSEDGEDGSGRDGTVPAESERPASPAPSEAESPKPAPAVPTTVATVPNVYNPGAPAHERGPVIAQHQNFTDGTEATGLATGDEGQLKANDVEVVLNVIKNDEELKEWFIANENRPDVQKFIQKANTTLRSESPKGIRDLLA